MTAQPKPNWNEHVCRGAHCKCMNQDGTCKNFHNGDHVCPMSKPGIANPDRQDELEAILSQIGMEYMDGLVDVSVFDVPTLAAFIKAREQADRQSIYDEVAEKVLDPTFNDIFEAVPSMTPNEYKKMLELLVWERKVLQGLRKQHD